MEGRGSDIDFSFYLFCYVFKRLVFPWNKYKLMYTIAGYSRKKKKRRAYWHLKLRERERGGVGTNETALKLTAVIIAGSMVSLYGKAQHTCIYKQHRIHGAALFPI